MYQQIAWLILEHYKMYKNDFELSCKQAKSRFRNQVWGADPATTAYRLQLYVQSTRQLKELIFQITESMDIVQWLEIKSAFEKIIQNFSIPEHARTFFNSTARHFFQEIHFNRDIYFPLHEDTKRVLRLEQLNCELHHPQWHRILQSIDWECDYTHTNCEILNQLFQYPNRCESITLQFYPELFYRNQEAYLIGERIDHQSKIAFAIKFNNQASGISIKELLMGEQSVKRIFEFTRSYFWVYTSDPIAMVNYLKKLMPSKPREQLFINIGYIRHGKSVMYHHLIEHLHTSKESLVIAPGIKGLVMQVFTIPSYHLVFKIIKDKSSPPKSVIKAHVKDRYKFVALHDRIGRIADTQEFLFLILPKKKFEPNLLQDLLIQSSEEVYEQGENVVLKNVYLERKMIPLDMYVKHEEERKSIEAIIDYGNAIKELAAANIFPGDLLLKNFGVTPEGRVIFYDYDEIVKVTECNFRTFPEYSESVDDDMDYYSAEQTYHVAPEDVFPQEFEKFLIPNGVLKDVFIQNHGELFTAKYWISIQEKIIQASKKI